MKKFSPVEAIEYAEKGLIEEWIHSFLLSEGNNKGLSQGLKKEKRYWIGPEEISLERLKRCCGPEEDMEFKVPEANWNKKVGRMSLSLNEGWEPPPLIVEFRENELSIRDGNHRYEALKVEKYFHYWTIIWCNKKEDFMKLKKGGLD